MYDINMRCLLHQHTLTCKPQNRLIRWHSCWAAAPLLPSKNILTRWPDLTRPYTREEATAGQFATGAN